MINSNCVCPPKSGVCATCFYLLYTNGSQQNSHVQPKHFTDNASGFQNFCQQTGFKSGIKGLRIKNSLALTTLLQINTACY